MKSKLSWQSRSSCCELLKTEAEEVSRPSDLLPFQSKTQNSFLRVVHVGHFPGIQQANQQKQTAALFIWSCASVNQDFGVYMKTQDLSTVFLIHRLLRKELWSQGLWLRSGSWSSGSLPVKPRGFGPPDTNIWSVLITSLWGSSEDRHLIFSILTAATGNIERQTHRAFSCLCVAYNSSVSFSTLKKILS